MQIDWVKMKGQVPLVVQDWQTLQVLMVGYISEESWAETLKSKRVTFFSRSKNRLWQKGESSGHYLNLISHHIDCDGDAVLALVEPMGPTCHRGTESCFGAGEVKGVGFINYLPKIIAARLSGQGDNIKSYTKQLVESGLDRVIQKVGEEAVEVVIAAKNIANEKSTASFVSEVADLFFHTLVLLQVHKVPLSDVSKELERRHQAKGSVK